MLLAAAAVIAASSRENPADQALRKKFAADRPSDQGRRVVTEAVFAYFRWYGWLTRTSSVTRQIQQALEVLMQGRTSFVIAQRLSTLRAADLILVLENGKIIARGTHDELLESSGLYAEIYQYQLRPGATEQIPEGGK